jgi:hypothetical protein
VPFLGDGLGPNAEHQAEGDLHEIFEPIHGGALLNDHGCRFVADNKKKIPSSRLQLPPLSSPPFGASAPFKSSPFSLLFHVGL